MRYLLTIAAVLIGFCRSTHAAVPEGDEVTGSATAASEAVLGEARQLFLAGRYVEAKDRYHTLQELAPIDAACGVADVLCATGHDDAVHSVLLLAVQPFDLGTQL